ncbi:MAG: hypothetical protein QF512_14900 [Alphaproteobacteria bacterium]|nr:hypothetical protein [Alphaproteobacteria bacterium]
MVDPFADLGTRIELVSTDKYFRDVSIGLYAREAEDGWCFRIRSFASYDGLAERIGFIVDAMRTLGGMELAGAADTVLFPCGGEHLVAVRRLFLQACKEKPDAAPESPVLSLWDKKSELNVSAAAKGQGAYELSAGAAEGAERRLTALRNAVVKLADAQADEDNGRRLSFDCGHDHDAMVGMLLQTAPNVRSVMREQEMNAAKGVLAAPGARE